MARSRFVSVVLLGLAPVFLVGCKDSSLAEGLGRAQQELKTERKSHQDTAANLVRVEKELAVLQAIVKNAGALGDERVRLEKWAGRLLEKESRLDHLEKSLDDQRRTQEQHLETLGAAQQKAQLFDQMRSERDAAVGTTRTTMAAKDSWIWASFGLLIAAIGLVAGIPCVAWMTASRRRHPDRAGRTIDIADASVNSQESLGHRSQEFLEAPLLAPPILAR